MSTTMASCRCCGPSSRPDPSPDRPDPARVGARAIAGHGWSHGGRGWSDRTVKIPTGGRKIASEAKDAARHAGESQVVETGARLGYVANGIIHLLIAWIALRVAWSSTGEEASSGGALENLRQAPLGPVLLWTVVVGFVLLASWYLTEGIRGTADASAVTRIRRAGKASVYLALAWTAFGFARGTKSSEGDSTADATAMVLGWPGGRLIVVAVGLVVAFIGARYARKGLTDRYLEDLEDDPGTLACTAARYGYAAKGAAYVVIAVLLVIAGWRHDSDTAAGLDGALRTLREQPFGPYLLTAVAVGLAAYGVYSFVRARLADH